ncbi:MAG TPA: D-alanyl-D-alanine carboxypeptidase/D-alanyl-D-alanine-endopeptidase [Rhodocyclaceae bacterium]|nr:D-alanyl-D-alanine carboxypeptidase/D-alanyl-D-alanine-endopeptidase [Rhodocyclaceae bacterium]
MRLRHLLGLVSGMLHAQGNVALPPTVVAALKAAQIPETHVAIVVQPVDAKLPLISHNARVAMNPASVMKLLTTYAALDLLGPAYTWRTDALADNAPVNGRLNGNLYLKGSGDPKLALEHFWALLRQLRVRGVQHIGGDVVLDRSAFNVPAIDPGAFDDKPMRPYNVGPDALLINFRSLRFTLRADNGRVQLLLETPADELRIDNQLKLTSGDCTNDWKNFINIRLRPDNGSSRLEFTGTFSAACVEKTLNLAPLPADAQVSGLFRALWKELGGTLAGQVRVGTTPATARLLARQESPALADIVRDINKWSNNVMTRQVYLTLGNSDGPATAERARQRIDAWLAGRGLKFDELVIENGAGLSRNERISADSLNRLLLDVWKSPVMPELLSSLPIVGIDGTMRKRLKDSDITGRAHIKTGTLNDEGVKTAAGIAQDATGKAHAVTILINHPRANFGQPVVDALLLWVAQQGL